MFGKINNKRGQMVDFATGTVVTVAISIFVIFAVLYGIATLNPGSFFAANSGSANATNQLQQNLTAGIAQFAVYIPTAFVILGVVLALSAIVLLIAYVRRMQSGNTSASL